MSSRSRQIVVGFARGALCVTVVIAVSGPEGSARAQPGKRLAPLSPIVEPLDFTIESDLHALLNGLDIPLPPGRVNGYVEIDVKGRLRGLARFQSALVLLNGKTRVTRNGQTVQLRGTANVDGKTNTKLSTKGIVQGGQLVGVTTLTDKARNISIKKANTTTEIPRNSNGFVRFRFQFEPNISTDGSKLGGTGFADTPIGRFPFKKLKGKAKGDKDGGDDDVTIKATGKNVKVTVSGTNDGTDLTGTASGKVGPFVFQNVPVVIPVNVAPGPFAQNLGVATRDVTVSPDGTFLAPVSIPLAGGASLDFEAGTVIRACDGQLVTGPITIEFDDGGVPAAYPASMPQDITGRLRVVLRGATTGQVTRVAAKFDPPAKLNVELGDSDGSFGDGRWAQLPPIQLDDLDGLLLGGSGGGGGGDRIVLPPLTFPDYKAGGGGFVLPDEGGPESVDLIGTGTFTFTHVPAPNPAPPVGDDRQLFFALDPIEDLGVKIKHVTIRAIDTGQWLGSSQASPANGASDGIGIGDGALFLIGKGGAAFTVEVVDGGDGPELKIETDIQDIFDVYYTACPPGGGDVTGTGVPSDPVPPDEEGVPGGEYVGDIEIDFRFKERDWFEVGKLRRALVPLVGADGYVSQGGSDYNPSGETVNGISSTRFVVEGFDRSTGTLGGLLPPGYTFVAGRRSMTITKDCAPLVPVVSDLTNDELVVLGRDPFEPIGAIPLPGRPGGLAAGQGRVYVISEGRVSCTDPAGGHVIGSRKIKGLGDGIDLSPGEDCMYVATEKGEFIAIDPITLRDKWKVDNLPEGFIPSIDVSPDGGTAVLTMPLEGQVVFVDLLRRTVSRIVPLPNAQSAAWSPDGETVAVTDINAGRVIFIDPDTGAQVSTSLPTGQTTVKIDYGPDGSFVGVGNFGSDTFSIIDIATGTIHQSGPVDGANGLDISDAEIDAAIKLLGTGFDDNSIHEWDVTKDGFGSGDRFDPDWQPGEGTYFFDEFESFR